MHGEGETCTVSNYDKNRVFPLNRVSIVVGIVRKGTAGEEFPVSFVSTKVTVVFRCPKCLFDS